MVILSVINFFHQIIPASKCVHVIAPKFVVCMGIPNLCLYNCKMLSSDFMVLIGFNNLISLTMN